MDISADFRLKQADVYSQWYGVEHPDPTYLEEAVYGLTELNRDAVADARLVANPGCYPSSAILALAPAIEHGLSAATSSWTASRAFPARAGP